jgi:GT2 family glycosyltransferase
VSFVIATFDRPAALRHSLAAVLAVEHPSDRTEVVIVDNAERPTGRAVVEALAKDERRVHYEHNPAGGAAAARNRGATLAHGEFLIFCDEDIVVRPSHVRRHLELQTAYPSCIAGGHWEFSEEVEHAWMATPYGRFRLALERSYRDHIAPLDGLRFSVSLISLSNLVIERRRFWDLNGLDERLPYTGIEDWEFATRAIAAGYLLIYDRSIRMRHVDQRSTFEQFCEREWHNAASRAALTSMHPNGPGMYSLRRTNGPIARSDGCVRIAKKLTKQLLGTGPSLGVVHRLLRVAEPALSDRTLARIYSAVAGIYVQSGFREGAEMAGGGPAA